jgi:hypothetical protein
MRRFWRLGAVAVGVLLALGGIYAGYWYIVAGRIESGLHGWQQSQKAHKIDASWEGLRVTGFPFAFRVEIAEAAFRDRSWNPAPELRVARLSAHTRPWEFDDWRLAAPDGFVVDLAAAGSRPAMKLTVKSAEGALATGAQGAFWLWVGAHRIAAKAPQAVPIRSADAWITQPATPPAKDTDPNFGLAVAMRDIGVQSPPVSFAKTIDELALGLTVKGVLAPGPLAQSVAAWREAGGTIEIDNLRLRWGGLGVSANGTLALDRKLQPIAALSGGIEGFDTIFDALVAADQMTPEQAALVKIALNSIARPGPDGKPQISAPFTIQNGKMYLGPARLGAAPHIDWE